jgi:hypothetical protein
MTVSLPTPCFFFTGARKKVGKHVPMLVSNVNFSKNYTKSNSENVSRNYLQARWGEKKTWGWEEKLLTLLALGPNHEAR